MTNYYDYDNVNLLLAEGHARMSAPLLNIAMAMLAIYAVLGGDFSRRGYALRIAVASAAALTAAAGGLRRTWPPGAMIRRLNVLQYLMPMLVIAAISFFYFVPPILRSAAGAPTSPRSPWPGRPEPW